MNIMNNRDIDATSIQYVSGAGRADLKLKLSSGISGLSAAYSKLQSFMYRQLVIYLHQARVGWI